MKDDVADVKAAAENVVAGGVSGNDGAGLSSGIEKGDGEIKRKSIFAQ